MAMITFRSRKSGSKWVKNEPNRLKNKQIYHKTPGAMFFEKTVKPAGQGFLRIDPFLSSFDPLLAINGWARGVKWCAENGGYFGWHITG